MLHNINHMAMIIHSISTPPLNQLSRYTQHMLCGNGSNSFCERLKRDFICKTAIGIKLDFFFLILDMVRDLSFVPSVYIHTYVPLTATCSNKLNSLLVSATRLISEITIKS